MVILLFLWLLLVAVALPVGLLLVPEEGAERVAPPERAVFAIWLGLALLALVMLGLALFAPLQWPGRISPPAGAPLEGLLLPHPVVIAVWLAGLLPLRSARVRRQLRALCCELDAFGIGLIIIPAILLALFASQAVTWFDTGLYHRQMTAMLAEFGVLKGAALIHQRFGFTSSWFALGALFPAQTLGGLATLLATLHFGFALRRILRRPALAPPTIVDWFPVFGYLLLLPFAVLGAGLALSPSPDLPAAFLTFIIAWWIPAATSPRQRFPVLLLGLLTFSIKLSALPVILVVVLNYLVGKPLAWRRWGVVAGLTVILTAPLLAANLLTSGCPLYPSGMACQEWLPWGIGAAEAEHLRIISSNFARTEGQSGQAGGVVEWFLDWMIDNQTGTLSNASFLTVVSFISLLLLGRDFARGRFAPEWRAPLLLGVLGSLYVLIMAPSLRFGIGYFILLPAIALAGGAWRTVVLGPLIALAVILLTPYTELEWRHWRLLVAGGIVGAYLLQLLLPWLPNSGGGWGDRLGRVMLLAALIPTGFSVWPRAPRLYRPTPVRQPPLEKLRVIQLKGFAINQTTDGPLRNQCWDAPRLCTPEDPTRPAYLTDRLLTDPAAARRTLRLLDEAAGISGGIAIEKRPFTGPSQTQ